VKNVRTANCNGRRKAGFVKRIENTKGEEDPQSGAGTQKRVETVKCCVTEFSTLVREKRVTTSHGRGSFTIRAQRESTKMATCKRGTVPNI